MAMGSALWSPTAEACGLSAVGAGAAMAAAQALLVVLLLSVISLVSLRAASRAFGRMRAHRPGPGFRVAHVASLVGYGVSVIGTIVSGGLLLALLLL